MKAKEYAKIYNELLKIKGKNYAIMEIYKKMFAEIEDIKKLRNVSSDSGMASIVMEMNQKWNSFVRLIGRDWINGFLSIVLKEIPDLKEVIYTQRKGRKK